MILPVQDFRTLEEIGFPGHKSELIVRDFQNITLSKAPSDCFPGILQLLPQRRAEIGIKGNTSASLLCGGNSLFGGLADSFVGHGQGAKVENTGIGDRVKGQLLLSEHHIRTGLAIEGEIPVAVCKGLNKGQGGRNLFIHHKRVSVDSGFRNHILQELAKHIVSDFANESTGLAQLAQHGQHIAGCSAGAGFKEVIPLYAGSVLGKINQQFAKGDHIKLVHGYLPF